MRHEGYLHKPTCTYIKLSRLFLTVTEELRGYVSRQQERIFQLYCLLILSITNYSLRALWNATLITFSLTSKHFLTFLCNYRNHTPVLFCSSLPFSIYSERRNGRQELIEANKEQVKNLHVRRRISIITRVSICNHLHHNSCICRYLRIFHIYHHHSRH